MVELMLTHPPTHPTPLPSLRVKMWSVLAVKRRPGQSQYLVKKKPLSWGHYGGMEACKIFCLIKESRIGSSLCGVGERLDLDRLYYQDSTEEYLQIPAKGVHPRSVPKKEVWTQAKVKKLA